MARMEPMLNSMPPCERQAEGTARESGTDSYPHRCPLSIGPPRAYFTPWPAKESHEREH
jgi:hypothetical protein